MSLAVQSAGAMNKIKGAAAQYENVDHHFKELRFPALYVVRALNTHSLLILSLNPVNLNILQLKLKPIEANQKMFNSDVELRPHGGLMHSVYTLK